MVFAAADGDAVADLVRRARGNPGALIQAFAGWATDPQAQAKRRLVLGAMAAEPQPMTRLAESPGGGGSVAAAPRRRSAPSRHRQRGLVGVDRTAGAQGSGFHVRGGAPTRTAGGDRVVHRARALRSCRRARRRPAQRPHLRLHRPLSPGRSRPAARRRRGRAQAGRRRRRGVAGWARPGRKQHARAPVEHRRNVEAALRQAAAPH